MGFGERWRIDGFSSMITKTSQKMLYFKNQTFPMDIKSSPNEQLTFYKCLFTNGTTFIPYHRSHVFEGCHFETGSVVCFVDQENDASFCDCVFDIGCKCQFTKDGGTLFIRASEIPSGESIFDGNVWSVIIHRSSPSQSIPILPQCGKLVILDCIWGLEKPTAIPYSQWD